jgi:predicted RNA methylase
VTSVLDPEEAHLAALRRLGDSRGRHVLELGCGDGRLTLGIAEEAASVLAFDPDAEAVQRARQSLPAELAFLSRDSPVEAARRLGERVVVTPSGRWARLVVRARPQQAPLPGQGRAGSC